VFFGLSVAGSVSQDMVKSMASKPIIFAMANPDPEITPEEVREARQDAIIATGRSDYPNQINNVLGFPYIFRGALDVRARTINEDMKIAAARAIAELAREDVPDEVAAAYGGRRLRYGPEYLIPVPFDPRLIAHIPAAVAKAAMDTGVAQKPIVDFGDYRAQLSARLDPTASMLHLIAEKVRSRPQRVVFAEGEEERVIRAALSYQQHGYGDAVLIGREDRVRAAMEQIGLEGVDQLEIHNARLSRHNQKYRDFLYSRLQREGHLLRDCQRMVNQDRNIFAACMLAMGDADAMITGTTRSFYVCYEDITKVIDPGHGEKTLGVSILLSKGRTIFVADTNVHVVPTAEELVVIAKETAAYARKLGHEPRVALVSYSNFGNPMHEATARIREAVRLLDREKVDFEYEGEMSAAIALNFEQQTALYPFSRLSGAANVLVMPALQSAHVATRLMQSLGGGTVIGPILRGLSKPVQICQMGANVSDILNVAALAAHDAVG
jgi:malate dehydrogenase (oxaloacetate-decarboxylating)(NADP+)